MQKQKLIAEHQEKMAKLDLEAKKAYGSAVMQKEELESRERMKSAELATKLAETEEKSRNNEAERENRLEQTRQQTSTQKELAGFKAGFEAIQNKIDKDTNGGVDNDNR